MTTRTTPPPRAGEHTRWVAGCPRWRAGPETRSHIALYWAHALISRYVRLAVASGNLYKLAAAAYMYSSSFIEAAKTFTTSEIVMGGTFKGLANAFPAAGFQPGEVHASREL